MDTHLYNPPCDHTTGTDVGSGYGLIATPTGLVPRSGDVTLLIVVVGTQGKSTTGEPAVVVPTRSLVGVRRRSRGERTWHRKDCADIY
jgi:hypothetical protein